MNLLYCYFFYVLNYFYKCFHLFINQFNASLYFFDLNYPNFLKETFGGYTNTTGNDHPNKEGHENWANLLSNKLEVFKYIEKKLI